MPIWGGGRGRVFICGAGDGGLSSAPPRPVDIPRRRPPMTIRLCCPSPSLGLESSEVSNRVNESDVAPLLTAIHCLPIMVAAVPAIYASVEAQLLQQVHFSFAYDWNGDQCRGCSRQQTRRRSSPVDCSRRQWYQGCSSQWSQKCSSTWQLAALGLKEQQAK